jgi:hypothetical protein
MFPYITAAFFLLVKFQSLNKILRRAAVIVVGRCVRDAVRSGTLTLKNAGGSCVRVAVRSGTFTLKNPGHHVAMHTASALSERQFSAIREFGDVSSSNNIWQFQRVMVIFLAPNAPVILQLVYCGNKPTEQQHIYTCATFRKAMCDLNLRENNLWVVSVFCRCDWQSVHIENWLSSDEEFLYLTDATRSAGYAIAVSLKTNETSRVFLFRCLCSLSLSFRTKHLGEKLHSFNKLLHENYGIYVLNRPRPLSAPSY